MGRVVCLGLAVIWAAGAWAQVPVQGGGGATLENIAGTTTMVTIVMKGSGAQDKNLRIAAVYDDYMTVVSERGDEFQYRFEDLAAIRVQGGKVTAQEFKLAAGRSLSTEQQNIVRRSVARAREIFDEADDNLPIKMEAAMLLAVGGDPKSRGMAIDFLESYADSNDLSSALSAAFRLHLAGQPNAARTLLSAGLNSGNRSVRAEAAKLAGLVREDSDDVQTLLQDMLRDRSGDVSAPAVRALARLQQRAILPSVLRMISEKETKAEAAVFALVRLGGEDVLEQMRVLLPESDGMTRFRIVRVLYALGDAEGKRILRTEIIEIPTLRVNAALLLAPKGDVKAMQILRERLRRRFDAVEETLVLRADAAAALIEGGDASEVSVFQDLLRSENENVERKVCQHIVRLGVRGHISITQPIIESPNLSVAVAACRAAIALAHPEFSDRLVESWE